MSLLMVKFFFSGESFTLGSSVRSWSARKRWAGLFSWMSIYWIFSLIFSSRAIFQFCFYHFSNVFSLPPERFLTYLIWGFHTSRKTHFHFPHKKPATLRGFYFLEFWFIGKLCSNVDIFSLSSQGLNINLAPVTFLVGLEPRGKK